MPSIETILPSTPLGKALTNAGYTKLTLANKEGGQFLNSVINIAAEYQSEEDASSSLVITHSLVKDLLEEVKSEIQDDGLVTDKNGDGLPDYDYTKPATNPIANNGVQDNTKQRDADTDCPEVWAIERTIYNGKFTGKIYVYDNY